MSIKDWPKDERPREKLLNRGPQTLSDAELLAIFLRTGVAGQSAVELARQLLKAFGSLSALLDADKTSFCQQHGLGPAKFVQLQAIMEMSRRHMATSLTQTNAFTDAETTQHFLKQCLRANEHEVFACLWLNSQHQMIAFEELFRGTIDGAHVYPREVVKRALHHNAAAVILAHNHPSGHAKASQADIAITQILNEALVLIDVRILDHIIIADTNSYSMAQHQQLN